MDIIFACGQNYKRKCGKSVKNLTFFAGTLPNATQIFAEFRANPASKGQKIKNFLILRNLLNRRGVLLTERFRRDLAARETVANSPGVWYNTRGPHGGRCLAALDMIIRRARGHIEADA